MVLTIDFKNICWLKEKFMYKLLKYQIKYSEFNNVALKVFNEKTIFQICHCWWTFVFPLLLESMKQVWLAQTSQSFW